MAFLGVVVVGVSPSRDLLAATMIINEPGDYNDDRVDPTVITPALIIGTNVVRGEVDGNSWFTDSDYVQIALPPASRLSTVTLTVSDYDNPEFTTGRFDVLSAIDDNAPGLVIDGNLTQAIGFSVGSQTNLILWASAAPAANLGQETYYTYEVELVVEPVVVLEPVNGIAVHSAIEVTFPAEAGRNYQVQCSSDLSSNSWTDLGSPIRGENASLSTFDSPRLAAQRFYRVVRQQVTEPGEVIEPVIGPELVNGTAIRRAVEVTFPTEGGRSYQLQCTSDLSSDDWIDVGSLKSGNGGTMSAFDSIRPASQPFYRVVTPQ